MRHRVISQMQQWKGKKKNKCFFGAKLIQSSLFVSVFVSFFSIEVSGKLGRGDRICLDWVLWGRAAE